VDRVDFDRAVVAHYGGQDLNDRRDLVDVVFEALAYNRRANDELTLKDLAPIDEFHVRGRQATAELGQNMGLKAGMAVVDVGSGLGGPSRHLADTHGCMITGIDLTNDYCRAARLLAERVGLADRVCYRHGNALEMPFEDGTFDAAYSQHMSMNVEDKEGLYREIARVLKPGGVFGLYDLLQGPGGAVFYPVPWARSPATSFMVAPDVLEIALSVAGFSIERTRDVTEAAKAWFQTMRDRNRSHGVQTRKLDYHRLLGEDFPLMGKNMVKNIAGDRVLAMEIICRKV
jgi:MPBQ/MSBQ methyltransferase